MKKTLLKISFIVFFLLSVAAFAAFIFFTLPQTTPKDADFSELRGLIQENNYLLLDAADVGSEQKLKANFDLYASNYQQVLYFSPKTAMSVSEILLIEAPKGGDLSDVSAAMKAHQSKRKETFRHYGVDQFSLLEQAVIYENSRYIFYVCGEDAEAVARFLKESVEE